MINFVPETGAGLATATSYVSAEEADDIAALNPHDADAWLTLPLDQKRQQLMLASRILDSRTTWTGERATDIQALEWPRKGVKDRYDNDVSASSVPFNVRWAVLELAKWNIPTNRLTRDRPENAVAEVKVDAITVRFADAASFAHDQYEMPDVVSDLLRGLGSVRKSSRKVTFGRLTRR